MKKDIRTLYKKDKKLAIQVAKALGYKIVAKEDVNNLETLKKQALKNIKKIPVNLKNVTKKFEDIQKRLEKGKLDDKMVDVLLVIDKAKKDLSSILTLIQKELRF